MTEPGKTIPKYNNIWLGIAIGLVFPGFCFFAYWLFAHSQMGFPKNFVRYLLAMESLSDTIKLCALGNLLVFYVFLNRKHNDTAKGIIIGTLTYLLLIVYLTFFVETAA